MTPVGRHRNSYLDLINQDRYTYNEDNADIYKLGSDEKEVKKRHKLVVDAYEARYLNVDSPKASKRSPANV